MNRRPFILATAVVLLCAASCSVSKKLARIQDNSVAASISLPPQSYKPREVEIEGRKKSDTIRVLNFEGKEVLLMNAIKDENGDMVAHDVIEAAVVTAKFRNVAERHGKVDLEFQVTVPAAMQDSKWQLRFTPDMYILQDTVRLESIIITGSEYRKAQLRGYQHYDRFVNSIITDTTKFINRWQLELFIERNIPALFAFKNDTTLVSYDQFNSVYGVTEQEAVDHFTNHLWKRYNKRKAARKGEMFRRYVKVPFVTEGIRLDTVVVNDNGDFIYNYIQTINTRPKLRKVEIVLKGEIYEQENCLCKLIPSEPLTFYISSLSAFVDGTDRYLTRVIERKVEANTACYIDFAVGKADIDESLGFNREEMGRIKSNIRDLVLNEKFDLDSITISAFASPEGSVKANDALALRRAKSASAFFSDFTRAVKDSLNREAGYSIAIGEDKSETISKNSVKTPDIRFISHAGGENWRYLDQLVDSDEQLSEKDKEDYRLCREIPNPDQREQALTKQESYKYLRKVLYPRLRVVNFDFYLHRKGMVKDTVHTTVLDSTYMAGVQAIRDRDYETAVTLLRPYNDYNTAIAYCSLDYNASALQILENLDRTPQVLYMLAVIYSRKGEDQQAVQCYLDACRQEQSYIHRGNLDPEISALIKRYDLLTQLTPQDDFSF